MKKDTLYEIYSILNNEILINSMKDNQKKMINYDSSKIIANEIFKEIKKWVLSNM